MFLGLKKYWDLGPQSYYGTFPSVVPLSPTLKRLEMNSKLGDLPLKKKYLLLLSLLSNTQFSTAAFKDLQWLKQRQEWEEKDSDGTRYRSQREKLLGWESSPPRAAVPSFGYAPTLLPQARERGRTLMAEVKQVETHPRVKPPFNFSLELYVYTHTSIQQGK